MGRGKVYTYRYTVTTRMTCIKMGSDESHFKVSLLVRTEIPGGKENGKLYLTLHCHHQNDSCIKMGSDESHFLCFITVRDKVTRQCLQITTFEEKGQPKQIRTDVHLFTSL